METKTLTLSAQPLRDFTHKLASADPTPGGGSASAAVAAFGAGLVRMVSLLTSNSPKHQDVSEQCAAIALKAERLTDTLLALVDEDAASFDRVSDAYRLPKASDAEKTARSAQIQTALQGAIATPLRVVQGAREICDLAIELVDIGNANALSDVGCAALCAQASSQGAGLNVQINAAALKDRAAADRACEELNAALAHVSLLAEVVLGKVRSRVEH